MQKKILFRRMLRNPQFLIGLAVVTAILIVSLFAYDLAPMDANKNNIAMRLSPPVGMEAYSKGADAYSEAGFALGTDALGRDILSRILIGSRVSLRIAFISTLLVTVIGTGLGILAGYFGGIVDDIIMRAVEVTMSVPSMTLGVVIMAIFGPSLTNLIIVMVVSMWKDFAKITRNQVFVIRNREFVQASRAMGGNGLHIMLTQILPNITTPLLIQISSCFGSVILTEAALSFLYLGVQPPDPSWGNMIAESRNNLAIASWTCIAPGVALMIAVLGFNFLGDGLRDILDPKQRR